MKTNIRSALFSLLFVAALSVATCGTQVYAKVPIAKVGTGENQTIVKLEVASTEQEITKGLMFRTSLASDHGMVFLFHPARHVNFWMYHTLIPLDMFFIKDGKIAKLMENVPPCKSENPSGCPTYPGGTGVEASEVLEVNAGFAKAHNIHEGDSISFDLP
jgi:uncharacterized membrane protein (UPF0127 family)